MAFFGFNDQKKFDKTFQENFSKFVSDDELKDVVGGRSLSGDELNFFTQNLTKAVSGGDVEARKRFFAAKRKIVRAADGSQTYTYDQLNDYVFNNIDLPF